MSRNFIIKLMFYASYATANAVAMIHLFAIISASTKRESIIYDNWLNYTFIVACVLLILSIFLSATIKCLTCILFCFGLIAFAIRDNEYISLYRNLNQGSIEPSSLIVILFGFILPMLGIVSGILLLRNYGDSALNSPHPPPPES